MPTHLSNQLLQQCEALALQGGRACTSTSLAHRENIQHNSCTTGLLTSSFMDSFITSRGSRLASARVVPLKSCGKKIMSAQWVGHKRRGNYMKYAYACIIVSHQAIGHVVLEQILLKLEELCVLRPITSLTCAVQQFRSSPRPPSHLADAQ